MNFYFFASNFKNVKRFDESRFEGVLFTYNIGQGDFFTKISRDILLDSELKYMVAIRPYVISPQYLCMINQSINEISGWRNRLQVNLISGHIKDNERDFGGIIGNVNDQSTHAERSNYLIEYIEALTKIKGPIPDCYVSATNQYTFKAASDNGFKMFIPYSIYKKGTFDLKNKDVMIAVTPRIRKTQKEVDELQINTIQHRIDMMDFTYEEFYGFVKDVESNGIGRIILSAWDEDETSHIIDFVKTYKLRELEESGLKKVYQ